jgi:outer membrane protein FlgP
MCLCKIKLITAMLALSAVLGSSGCAPIEVRSEGSVIKIAQQELVISATGYAVISVQASDNPAQQRLLAIRASKLDAYRGLVEQVYGQYVDGSTTISDLVLSDDVYRAKVQGVIYGAQLVSVSPVGEDTYEVTLSLRRSVVNDLRLLYLKHMKQLARA